MIHLITYGTKQYYNAKKKLNKEAIEAGWFDTIELYSPSDIDDDFKERFSDILECSEGGGYWIWKCYFIEKKLNLINDGDILIYLDAGCKINILGEKRFFEYIDILNNSDTGIISFQLPKQYIEKKWTTKEIFNYFDVSSNDTITNSRQIVGGIRIMKKNKNLIHLINLEKKALYDNALLFTKYYDEEQNNYFKKNRHDQSIFSVIRKLHEPILIDDETYFRPFGSGKSLEYPIWAKRRK